MLTNVPTAINALARKVVINHPNSVNIVAVRKRVTRPGPLSGGLPTMGGMGVISSDDEESIEWDLLGNGYALKAQPFESASMMDRQDANNGSGDEFRYLLEPEVLPGNGTGAALTPVITDGVVTSVTIVTGGTGYMDGQNLAFVGAGTGAIAEIAVTDGVITGITVTEGGTGYTTAPIATVSDFGFDFKKKDVFYLIIGATRLAYEIIGVETTSDIPPYTQRYITNRRDDLHFSI
jgi:hypothetical protein